MAATHREYDVISADSHVVEPPDLWDKWLERKYREKAPKLVKDEEGGDAWLYEPNGTPAPLGLVTIVGQPYDQFKWPGAKYGVNIHPSCYEGKARLDVLDTDGVDAEVLYPPQRAVMSFMKYTDSELQLAGVQAYNRWLRDGFCAADPERLLGMYQLPNLGIETSVAEMKRAKDQGFRGVIMASWPSGNDRLTRADDPFWAAAEEMGMPINIHFRLASQKGVYKASKEADVAVGATAGFLDFPLLVIDLIFHGVFDRYPRLKVVGVETGAGWVPHFLSMMDDRYWRNRTWAKTSIKKIPSQYWKDNFLCTFISGTDRVGIEIRHAVGVENMCWSTDFPHHGNDYPYSRKVIEDIFINVPEEEKKKILSTNAAKLYGLVN